MQVNLGVKPDRQASKPHTTFLSASSSDLLKVTCCTCSATFVCAQIDKPVTPGNMGMKLFLHDLSDDMRQVYRDHLFAVTREDIMRAAKT